MGSEVAGRLDFWTEFIHERQVLEMAEIGVYRGEFAEHILRHCPDIRRYLAVDPWSWLPNWNKPFNLPQGDMNEIKSEALRRLEPFEDRVVVMDDLSRIAARMVPPDSLDLVYIDGDHTLRGILTDLVCWIPKVREGGAIGFDDFVSNIWHHGADYEPSLVFPTALYFAEALNYRCELHSGNQFVVHVQEAAEFEFVDHTGALPEFEFRESRMPLRPSRMHAFLNARRGVGALRRLVRST